MRAATALWTRFWFRPVTPHLFALLRIVWGVLGLLALYAVADLDVFWRTDGIVWPTQSSVHDAAASLTGPALAPAAALAAVALAYVFMIAGVVTPLTVPLAFVATFCAIRWNPLPLSAAYQVYLNLLFCVALSDCGRVWSVDAWLERRRRRAAPAEVAIWPLRLFRFQVCVIYGFTGLWKFQDVHWRDGSALHYVLSNTQFRRFPIDLPTWSAEALTIGTYVTLLWEVLFPVMILWRPTRWVTLALGVAMHVGMAVTLELGPFPYIMLGSYVAFLEPDTVPALAARLRARFGRRSTPISAPL
jgi:hypothetical protein